MDAHATDAEFSAPTDELTDEELQAEMEQFTTNLRESLQGQTLKLTLPAEMGFHLITYAIVEMKRVETALGKPEPLMREYFTNAAKFFGTYGIEAQIMIEELLK